MGDCLRVAIYDLHRTLAGHAHHDACICTGSSYGCTHARMCSANGGGLNFTHSFYQAGAEITDFLTITLCYFEKTLFFRSNSFNDCDSTAIFQFGMQNVKECFYPQKNPKNEQRHVTCMCIVLHAAGITSRQNSLALALILWFFCCYILRHDVCTVRLPHEVSTYVFGAVTTRIAAFFR